MKATVLATLLLIVSLASFATEPVSDKSPRITSAAAYRGGDKAYNSFVSTVLSKVMRAGIARQLPSGSYIVTLRFDIDARGNVLNVQAISTNGFGLEEAAIAQFRTSARWTPARSASGSVKTTQTQNFRFDVF